MAGPFDKQAEVYAEAKPTYQADWYEMLASRTHQHAVATAANWFDLPTFYSLAKRVLRGPGGVIAIWGYNHMDVNPEFNVVEKLIRKVSQEFRYPNARYMMEGYRTITFLFESVGLGKEGEPLQLSIQREVSFQGVLKVAQSSSAPTIAKENEVGVLSEDLIEDLEVAWGGRDLVRTVSYKAFMLAGTIA